MNADSDSGGKKVATANKMNPTAPRNPLSRQRCLFARGPTIENPSHQDSMDMMTILEIARTITT